MRDWHGDRMARAFPAAGPLPGNLGDGARPAGEQPGLRRAHPLHRRCGRDSRVQDLLDPLIVGWGWKPDGETFVGNFENPGTHCVALPTGVGAAVNSAAVRPGETVVVIGAGGVGLNAIQGARIAGARRIVAVDMLDEKLDVAREFGATDVVSAKDAKPWRKVKQILGRGADAVLVTVGVAQVYDQAPRYLAASGNVIMVGMPHGDTQSSFSPLNMADQGQGFIGSKMGNVVIKRDIPWMIDLYKQGRLKLDELISGRWSLDQINEAIADTKTGSAKRNVIVFD